METPFYGYRNLKVGSLYKTRHGDAEITSIKDGELTLTCNEDDIYLSSYNMQGEIGSCVIVNVDCDSFDQTQLKILQDFLPQVGILTMLSTAKYGYKKEELEGAGFTKLFEYPTIRSEELEFGTLYVWTCPNPKEGLKGYLSGGW